MHIRLPRHYHLLCEYCGIIIGRIKNVPDAFSWDRAAYVRESTHRCRRNRREREPPVWLLSQWLLHSDIFQRPRRIRKRVAIVSQHNRFSRGFFLRIRWAPIQILYVTVTYVNIKNSDARILSRVKWSETLRFTNRRSFIAKIL